jgi:hypothetical protein
MERVVKLHQARLKAVAAEELLIERIAQRFHVLLRAGQCSS